MATKNEDTDFDNFDYPVIYEREWFNMFNKLEDTVRKAAIVIIAAMFVGALSFFFSNSKLTMATIKSYTDLEQSKKLAEILSLESADMYYCYGMDIKTKEWSYDNTPTIIDEENKLDIDIPCWSLAALLDIMPDGTDIVKEEADTENEKYMCTVGVKDDIICTFGNNPVDACVAMVEKLHELKML